MNGITCQCGGHLELDWEESRKNEVSSVYSCEVCGKLFVLQVIGEKPQGWKTKKKLKEKEELNNIPF